jgi:hypothetical protein
MYEFLRFQDGKKSAERRKHKKISSSTEIVQRSCYEKWKLKLSNVHKDDVKNIRGRKMK